MLIALFIFVIVFNVIDASLQKSKWKYDKKHILPFCLKNFILVALLSCFFSKAIPDQTPKPPVYRQYLKKDLDVYSNISQITLPSPNDTVLSSPVKSNASDRTVSSINSILSNF